MLLAVNWKSVWSANCLRITLDTEILKRVKNEVKFLWKVKHPPSVINPALPARNPSQAVCWKHGMSIKMIYLNGWNVNIIVCFISSTLKAELQLVTSHKHVWNSCDVQDTYSIIQQKAPLQLRCDNWGCEWKLLVHTDTAGAHVQTEERSFNTV